MKEKQTGSIIIYSDNKIPVAPLITSDKNKWDELLMTNDEYSQLYNGIYEAFNGLSEFQKFYATIMFTNTKHHQGKFGIIYLA